LTSDIHIVEMVDSIDHGMRFGQDVRSQLDVLSRYGNIGVVCKALPQDRLTERCL